MHSPVDGASTPDTPDDKFDPYAETLPRPVVQRPTTIGPSLATSSPSTPAPPPRRIKEYRPSY